MYLLKNLTIFKNNFIVNYEIFFYIVLFLRNQYFNWQTHRTKRQTNKDVVSTILETVVISSGSNILIFDLFLDVLCNIM